MRSPSMTSCPALRFKYNFSVSLAAAPDHLAMDNEIGEACRLSNFDHIIEALPEGYNTEYGFAASRLSGGLRMAHRDSGGLFVSPLSGCEPFRNFI